MTEYIHACTRSAKLCRQKQSYSITEASGPPQPSRHIGPVPNARVRHAWNKMTRAQQRYSARGMVANTASPDDGDTPRTSRGETRTVRGVDRVIPQCGANILYRRAVRFRGSRVGAEHVLHFRVLLRVHDGGERDAEVGGRAPEICETELACQHDESLPEVGTWGS